jgi:hypothetical protein
LEIAARDPQVQLLIAADLRCSSSCLGAVAEALQGAGRHVQVTAALGDLEELAPGVRQAAKFGRTTVVLLAIPLGDSRPWQMLAQHLARPEGGIIVFRKTAVLLCESVGYRYRVCRVPC